VFSKAARPSPSRSPDDPANFRRPSIGRYEGRRASSSTLPLLVKIGFAFSGDWLLAVGRIEERPRAERGEAAWPGSLGLTDAIQTRPDKTRNWRPVEKGVGLPDAGATLQRDYAFPLRPNVPKSRKPFRPSGPSSSPSVYAPQVIVANMDTAGYIRFLPLSITSSAGTCQTSQRGLREQAGSRAPPCRRGREPGSKHVLSKPFLTPFFIARDIP